MKRQQTSLRFAGVVLAAGLFAACGGPQYPNCNDDSNCHEGEYCVNGMCQQCRPDANDCPSGQQCVDGRCDPIEGYCASSGDCPDGQECRNNQCVTPQVMSSQETGPTGCNLSTVYFAYDSSSLDGSARTTMQSNAQCIQERDVAAVSVIGHTDPRGTEEYNLALGERRAQQVKTYLRDLGVDASRVSTRSMGEEMASGQDESGWSRDRRVEFQER